MTVCGLQLFTHTPIPPPPMLFATPHQTIAPEQKWKADARKGICVGRGGWISGCIMKTRSQSRFPSGPLLLAAAAAAVSSWLHLEGVALPGNVNYMCKLVIVFSFVYLVYLLLLCVPYYIHVRTVNFLMFPAKLVAFSFLSIVIVP